MITALLFAVAVATQPAQKPPDAVVLKQLENLYQPVAFDHRSHAKMTEMWGGCTTCHHRQPPASTRPLVTQACRTCHSRDEKSVDMKMPSLKAAYHRQCLNCHREWMHENACLICHAAKDPKKIGVPSADDIVGRMHPPIPEPETHAYRVRFGPADGRNVLFRHKEHSHDFGVKCSSCHFKDSCISCHDRKTAAQGPRPMTPGKTWAESHAPCMPCHRQQRCRHCHYQDSATAPTPFVHNITGQTLDADHRRLKCLQCHTTLRKSAGLTCGGAACHAKNPAIAFPAHRPGPFLAPVKPTPATTRATSRPATQPTIRKIRIRLAGE